MFPKTISASRRLCGLILLLAVFCLLTTVAAQTRDYARWVDPFIGTGGHGHTFPGAVMPFGMVQLSPDTRETNWDGSSGYHYSDEIIYGFSHTHLSGTGIPDGCDILFMPIIGDPQFSKEKGDQTANSYVSKFSHENERAEPGYYSVKLDNGILAELTATKRVGVHRYTFSKSNRANIILDLNWRDKVIESGFKVTANTRIEGFRRSSSWARDQIVYFVADFSKPFDSMEIEKDPSLHGNSTGTQPPEYERASRVAFQFKTSVGEQILVNVALSSVSVDGARRNLSKEIGLDSNFDQVRIDAKTAWNKELSKIEVSGGTDAQTTTFYTALYHTMIHPSIFNDVDGNYRGHDGKIHNIADDAAVPLDVRRSSASPESSNKDNGGSAAGSEQRRSRKTLSSQQRKSGAFPHSDGRSPKSDQYTVFSLWDTFRAAHPLYTIIEQKRTVDFINSFIRMYEQGGRLPVWELWGNETDTMIGYHAVSVIADAMAKGIKGFDYKKAYEAAKHSAELDDFGLAAYKKRGYISMEDENESVSKTLEYAYDDWCIMSMAATLYNIREFEKPTKRDPKENAQYLKRLADDVDKYRLRAASFQNLFDPESRFFRPRQNGGFAKQFTPQEVTFNFTEGNSWQYSFFVPHDVSSLISLMGGTQAFTQKLDELFGTETKVSGREQPDITGLMGQYAHGNEPSHHIAYLYGYSGAPSKTQARVRRIMDEFYKPTPDGLVGNEDCGQMSAWYVLGASGFYPVVPGQTRYDLGTPLFRQVIYHLENGKTFTIRAPNVSSSNIYINSAKWNGRPETVSYIVQEQIMSGGVLELEMSSKPNDAAFEHYSVSTVFHDAPAVPIIGDGRRAFREFLKFTIKSITPNAKVYYTLDGSEPNEKALVYDLPVTITADTTVKAVAVYSGGGKSQVAEAHYHRLPNDWHVKIDSKYDRQYTGGGDNGLIDGIRGSVNFASGEWQGYQGQDLVATIDLQKETEIKKVGGGFLQVARSWIWMPTHIEFEVSSDNVNFTRVADIKTDIDPKDMEPKIRDYAQAISPVRARYVRVHAYNLGKIPAWHPGAGDDAFIFVDEIIIQ